MPYCTLDNLKDLTPEQEILELADDTGSTDITNTAVVTVIDGCIKEGDNIIDGYIRGRYKLPLNPIPGLINNISSSLALYFLHKRRYRSDMPETLEKDYKRQIEKLKDIQKAVITLDVPTVIDESGSLAQGAYRTSNKERFFSASVLRRY